MRDAQRSEHPGMLSRLRHHAVVGRDGHQVGVDTGRARDHRSHEPLVPRNVDESDLIVVGEPARESEVDGDPAPLLLGEAVGIDAGECPHQRRLAMIDVAGGADDAAFAHGRILVTRSARKSRARH